MTVSAVRRSRDFLRECTASVFRVEVLSSSISLKQKFLSFFHVMDLFESLVKPTDLFSEEMRLNA